MPTRVVILGAAGRDFHNFNVLYRDNPEYRVVGFTATQIPDIAGRKYPPELAGGQYPDGIPILPEEDLETLIADHEVDLASDSGDRLLRHAQGVAGRPCRATRLRASQPASGAYSGRR